MKKDIVELRQAEILRNKEDNIMTTKETKNFKAVEVLREREPKLKQTKLC